jgi:hypothetical protein
VRKSHYKWDYKLLNQHGFDAPDPEANFKKLEKLDVTDDFVELTEKWESTQKESKCADRASNIDMVWTK